MKKKLFISRALEEESPIRDLANAHNFDLLDESLIEFTPVAFNVIPDCDWVFFYSKNGVKYFFQRIHELGMKLQAQVATMGLGTLNALKPFGKSADFAGNGHPQQVAEAFQILAEGQRVLFPRARQSKKSVQSILKGDIDIIDLVVYDNHYRRNFELPHLHYLLFTSPMNAEAYFNVYRWSPDQKIFAIGKTTTRKLHDLGIPNVFTAENPSEKALAELLRMQL